MLLLLSACGEDEPTGPGNAPADDARNPADATAIAQAIESRLDQGPPLQVRVACPRDVEWQAGRTFTCLVKTPKGQSRAEVTLGEAVVDPGGRRSGSGRTAQGEYSWTMK